MQIKSSSDGDGLKTAAYLIVLLWGLAEAKSFFIPLCLAGLLGFLMAPLHQLLRKHLRIPEVLSIALSAVVMVSPLFLVGYLLVRQGQGLVQDFPHLMQSGQEHLTAFTRGSLGMRLGMEKFEVQDVFQKVSSGAGEGLAFVVGGLAALLNAGSQGALILIFSILMLASRVQLRRSGERILSRSASFRETRLLDDVVSLIQHFLTARMLIVGIIGGLSAAALAIFGLKYSVFLGALLGVFTLVPAVGFIIALIPTLAVAIATGHSLGSILGMVACLVVFNLLEGNYLTPKMVGSRLNINALSSFVGLFAGGLMWGVWGMFLSVPILGVIRICFNAVPALQPWSELLADRESPEN
ncbi:MAG: AI-2E family transporter [Methylotenera sp.]|nr:AI-2E family transporter [Oligoflexia bacterium]